MVRPLEPRAEQHRDAATAQRGVEELDQQAAARREPDGEEVSEPCRPRDCGVVVLVVYIGHISRFTGVASWSGGVVGGPVEDIFYHLLSL